MIHALGYSLTPFDPSNPGRLCRGRELWVEAPDGETCASIERFVISGACFSDDTAHDALRGIEHSGLRHGEILRQLFGNQLLLGFCEQGSPLQVPDGAILREPHLQPRYGGHRKDPCVRWRVPVRTPAEIDDLLTARSPSADGLVPFDGTLSPELEEALFLLTGQGERLDEPERRIQPLALLPLLELVPWVVIAHLDKHASILAVYGRGLRELPERLAALANARGVLPVPFSIPPMLARWDRALLDLRHAWSRRNDKPFPVPEGQEAPLSVAGREQPDEDFEDIEDSEDADAEGVDEDEATEEEDLDADLDADFDDAGARDDGEE